MMRIKHIYQFVSILLFSSTILAQTTVDFGPGSHSWTVPSCVSNIEVEIGGSQGGGPCGGAGALITGTIPLEPGDVLTMEIGEQPTGINGGASGYGSGGNGHLSVPANPAYDSWGGGGATAIYINGVLYMVVGAGGGEGGGSNSTCGGAGGCGSGAPGNNTFGAGGQPGTQTAPGAGGAPWAGTPPGGYPGVGSNGGNGGPWETASGGGGGGGYYGGGGGGNDGCCTGANGGGGGGGGSSLVPAGFGCVQGANFGDGSASISFGNGLSANASNTGPFCSGQTINLSASGGAIYEWTGPNGFTSTDQNPVLTNATEAMSGTYTVMVTDPAACDDTVYASTDVIVYLSPTVDPIADIVVCNTDPVNIPAWSGNSGTATYAWTNSNTQIGLAASGNGNIPSFAGNAITNDQVGTITVTPTNGICVGIPEVFTVTVYRDPTLTVSTDTTICENGTATLVATGAGAGGGPYTYHWDHTVDTQGTQDVNPMVNTSYTVYVESLNGCTSNPETIDVSMYPPLSGNISALDTICPGYPTDVWASISGGIGAPYSFVWNTGGSQIGPLDIHQFSANPPVTQDYIVTVTDGCESTPVIMATNIFVAPLPNPQYQVLDPEQCEPAVFHIVNTTDPALSQYNYWLVDGEYEYVNQDTIVTPEFYEGTYDIQMIITTFEGCVDSTTFNAALSVKPKPIASFQHSPNPVKMFNTQVIFTSTSFLANEHEWYFGGAYPATSSEETAITTFPDGQTGTYDITLIVTSELGCKDTTDYQLIVLPEVIIYAPNAFTPDGDEHNQGWRVYMEGIDIYDFELLIFDRWGEVVWESHDISIPWDGTYSGVKLTPGTYTWTITTKDIVNDAKYEYNGHVSIIK